MTIANILIFLAGAALGAILSLKWWQLVFQHMVISKTVVLDLDHPLFADRLPAALMQQLKARLAAVD